jgi:hypothetical protein
VTRLVILAMELALAAPAWKIVLAHPKNYGKVDSNPDSTQEREVPQEIFDFPQVEEEVHRTCYSSDGRVGAARSSAYLPESEAHNSRRNCEPDPGSVETPIRHFRLGLEQKISCS